MKLLFSILVVIFVVVVAADRPTYSLESRRRWSTISFINGLSIGLSTKNDLLVYPDVSDSTTPVIAIRRRNAEGVYVPVANFTETVSPSTTTNGKWIAVSDGDNPVNVTLFTIGDNNNISSVSSVATRGGFLLSDDTFVGFDPVSLLDDGNFTIRTYQYQASNNTWINIPGTELVVRSEAKYYGDASTYRATDTHLVFLDMSDPSNFTVRMYTRQPNLSWKFFDSVPVNSTVDPIPGSVTFNGETLVFARFGAVLATSPLTYGEVYVYSKTSNGWTEQTFNLLELGYRPAGLLGNTVIFVNADTMLVSVGLEGYNFSDVIDASGKVLLLIRENGMWNDSLDFVCDKGLFGFGLAINDYDVIASAVSSIDNALHSITFFTAPLSVTNLTPPVAPVSDVQGTPPKQSESESGANVTQLGLGPLLVTVAVVLNLLS